MPHAGFAFARASRLITPAAYKAVFKHPKKSSDRYFTVLARPTGQSARLGLVVAKKKAKRAVDRNRIKRVIRETFRLHPDAWQGFDIVVIAQSSAVGHNREALVQSLLTHAARLQRAKV